MYGTFKGILTESSDCRAFSLGGNRARESQTSLNCGEKQLLGKVYSSQLRTNDPVFNRPDI